MAESSLRHNMNRTYGIVLTQTRWVDISGGGTETYVMYFMQVLKLVSCPVDGCLARENNPGRLI